MIGERLGIYEIVERLGRGGTATVYRAYQPALHRFVALKVFDIPRSSDGNATMAQRFQREARLIANLEHPHILPVFDFDGQHQPPYIVTRYLEGGSLANIRDRRPLPATEIVHLLRQVGEALAYAHRQGVVHRDIKPSNIMIDLEGNAFVTDFGIARAFHNAGLNDGAAGGENLTLPGTILGTPTFMAPEQIYKPDQVDHRADIYALAVTLFVLLTGQPPFKPKPENDIGNLLHQHLHAPIPRISEADPSLPVVLDGVFEIALAKNPDDRFDSVLGFVTKVLAALGREDSVSLLRDAARRHNDDLLAKRSTTGGEVTRLLNTFAQGRSQALVPNAPTSTTSSQQTSPEFRRQITAAYIDLSDLATQRYASGDEEQAHQVMTSIMAQCVQTATAFGGSAHNVTDTSAIFIWGMADVREDEPERAIRAMLAVNNWLETQTPRTEVSEEAAHRMSIDTGVILITQDKDQQLRTPTGQVLTKVARLVEHVPPGKVVLTHDTYRLVRGVFDLEPLSSVRLRGQKEATELYVALQARHRAFRVQSRGIEGLETRMIGREAELKQLQDAVTLSLEDVEAQVITVIGEPGVGKSRLLFEFSNWIDLHDVLFWLLQGRATQESQRQPYSLIRDILSNRFEIFDNDALAIAKEKFILGMTDLLGTGGPHKARLLGQLIGFDFSDDPEVRQALNQPDALRRDSLATLRDFFRAANKRTPTILLAEDMHWADDQSLDLLNRVLEDERSLRLMVLYTARPTLLESRPAWGEGQPFHSRIRLLPLTPMDSRRLVKDILRKLEDIPAELRDLIVNRAEGVPFYTEEIIKVLIEDGTIVPGAERWHLNAQKLAQSRIPSTLTGVLQARLNALSPLYLSILQRASVIGRLFWDAGIEALCVADGITSEQVRNALETLRKREYVLVREESIFTGTREYLFNHALFRDVTYASLPLRLQRLYHEQVAAWLNAVSGDRANEYYAQIAEHYEKADKLIAASTILLKASKRARLIGAFSEAMALLQRIDQWLVNADDAEAKRTWVAAQLALGEIAAYTGAHSQARQHLITALDRARSIDDRVAMAETLAHLGRISMWLGDLQAAKDYLAEAVPIVRQLDDKRALIFVLRQVGNVGIVRKEWEPARAALIESLAMARQQDDPEAISLALNSLGEVECNLGRFLNALINYEEALTIARHNGNRYSASLFLLNIAYVKLATRSYAEAHGTAEEALGLARENGAQSYVATLLIIAGGAMIAQNNGADLNGKAKLREGARLARELGEMPVVLSAFPFFGLLHMRQRDVHAALRLFSIILKSPLAHGSDVVIAQGLLDDLRAAGLAAAADMQWEEMLASGASVDLEMLLDSMLG